MNLFKEDGNNPFAQLAKDKSSLIQSRKESQALDLQERALGVQEKSLDIKRKAVEVNMYLVKQLRAIRTDVPELTDDQIKSLFPELAEIMDEF